MSAAVLSSSLLLRVASLTEKWLRSTPVASGSVHSPFKQQVGDRLARGGLGVAYGMTDANKVDPVALSASASGTSVTVKLGGLGPAGVILTDNKSESLSRRPLSLS